MLCSKCHALVHGGYLKITGTAPDNLTFEDHRGRPLAHCIGTEIAGWLDSWLGWKTDQSRLFRFYAGELDQLVPDP